MRTRKNAHMSRQHECTGVDVKSVDAMSPAQCQDLVLHTGRDAEAAARRREVKR